MSKRREIRKASILSQRMSKYSIILVILNSGVEFAMEMFPEVDKEIIEDLFQ